ncbi:MAG: sodium-dependent bicarbonate transport family permease [Myxococcota bacterium]
MSILELAGTNLTSPPVLFFLLGISAAILRSDLAIPQAVAKSLALYLMLAIGFKGGAAIAEQGVSTVLLTTMLLATFLASLVPFMAYLILRAVTKLNGIEAASVAGHYGSISVVTFVAATQALDQAGLRYEGFMVAAAAMMETPAIVVALLLARRHVSTDRETKESLGELMREVLFNGSIVILLGAFVIGIISGKSGLDEARGFLVDPFKGVLMLFLLDMGLVAGRSLGRAGRDISFAVIAFGVLMPVVSASVAVLLGSLTPLSVGGLALLLTLTGSASYIAVPAAMRIALPEANPAISLTLSLGVTFPFNLTVGIPIYIAASRYMVG